MSVSISTVEGSQPEKLSEASEEVSGKITTLETIITGEREDLSYLQQSWQGEAATAALSDGLQKLGKQERFRIRLGELRSALKNGGEQLGALRKAIVEMVHTLVKLGFSVSDDGVVTPHQWLVGRFLHGVADRLTTVLQQLLTTFDEVDHATAAAIAQASGSSIPNPPVNVAGQDIQIPSPDTSADDVKKWWDSLSDEQRRALVAQHPPLLGNLNGVQADVRDQVNVQVMDDDIHRVEDVASQHHVSADDVAKHPGAYGLSASDVTRYQNAKNTQRGLYHDMGLDGYHGDYKDLDQYVKDNKLNPRPAMLWAYDPLAFSGKGKAAIAIGNPDKSPNTAVIVPGTGASVSGGWLSDGHNDAINLFDQSAKADPDHSTAVIAWMGYDTPSSFNDLNVGNPGLAQTGGDLLAWDVNSLSVTHDGGVPQHVTVIGHSYGSTTVADAFARSGMQANDAVLLGCPGTDAARTASDFHLDGGHVYVGDASTDFVGWLGEAGGVPNALNDALGNPVGAAAGLGPDPAHEGFGATRFRAEVPGSESIHRDDHSYYYHVGSESLHNMTDIATGHSENLAPAGQRVDVPYAITPTEVHVPGIGSVPLPHIDLPWTDPEWNRPGSSITDDHGF